MLIGCHRFQGASERVRAKKQYPIKTRADVPVNCIQ